MPKGRPNPAQGLRMIAARTGKPLSAEWRRHISEGLMKIVAHRASKATFMKKVSDRRTGKSLRELEGHKPHLYADERCEICARPNSAPFRRMHRDHNHSTKQRRGILCFACNIALGYFHDDVALLRAAIAI